MRVGYVVKKFPRLSETFILHEVLELERQGIEVTILSLHRPDDGLFHPVLAQLRRPVIYLADEHDGKALGFLRKHVSELRAGQQVLGDALLTQLELGAAQPFATLRWALEILLVVRRLGLQRLHAHFATIASETASVAAAAAGVPFTFTCHAKDIYERAVQPVRFQRLAAAAEFVITVCEANRTYIHQHLAAAASARVVVHYNGVDLDVFHPRDRRESQQPLVLGVGRLVEKKGFQDLIAAVGLVRREQPEVSCVIVGDGEQRAQLEQQARATGGVVLVGARTQEEVRAYLTRATMLVLPCIVAADGNRDALPTVILEALASGVPVVSTPVTGIDEMLDSGRAGVLAPPGDVPALARAIGDLLGDPDRRTALAALGRARAEQLFDLRSNGRRLAAMFAQGAVAAGAPA